MPIAEKSADNRLCVSCRHFSAAASCDKVQDLITGEPTPARLVRSTDTMCGIDGKWWEEETWREDRKCD